MTTFLHQNMTKKLFIPNYDFLHSKVCFFFPKWIFMSGFCKNTILVCCSAWPCINALTDIHTASSKSFIALVSHIDQALGPELSCRPANLSFIIFIFYKIDLVFNTSNSLSILLYDFSKKVKYMITLNKNRLAMEPVRRLLTTLNRENLYLSNHIRQAYDL